LKFEIFFFGKQLDEARDRYSFERRSTMEITVNSRRPLDGNFDQFVRKCTDDPETPDFDTKVYTNLKHDTYLVVLPPSMKISGLREVDGVLQNEYSNSPHGLDHNFFWGQLCKGMSWQDKEGEGIQEEKCDPKAYQLNNEFMAEKMSEFLEKNPKYKEDIPMVPIPFRAQGIDPGPGLAGALLNAGAPNFFTGDISIRKVNETASLKSMPWMRGYLIIDAQGDRDLFQPLTLEAAKKILDKIQFQPLPRVQEPAVLGRMPDGKIFYFDVPRTDYVVGENDIANGRRIFMGEPGSMRQLEVTSAGPVGARISFATKEGRLDIFPPPAQGNPPGMVFHPPEGDPQPIKLLDLDQKENQELLKSLGIDTGLANIKVPDFP
jgi:hypothetical protein